MSTSDTIASTKPSWIVMYGHCIVCVCTLEALYYVRLDDQALCHVRDFQRSAVDHRAADHDSRHDVFASSHHGGVGSDAADDQVKTHLGVKIDVV